MFPKNKNNVFCKLTYQPIAVRSFKFSHLSSHLDTEMYFMGILQLHIRIILTKQKKEFF